MKRGWTASCCVLTFLCTLALEHSAHAAGGGPPGILFGETALPSAAQNAETDLWTRSNLLGDIGELRPWMQYYGLQLGITETSEVLGNPTGGIRQGAIYEGVTDLNLGWDLRTYFGWRGVFFARAYQIHGRGLSANDLYCRRSAGGSIAINGIKTA